MMEKGKKNRKVLYYIFRVTRKDPKTGEILDARDYGLKAWRIPIYDTRAA